MPTPTPNNEIVSYIEWQGIPIAITYTLVWASLEKIYKDTVVSHIAIKTKDRLPMSKTGYRSKFFHQKRSEMLTLTEVVQHVIKLLDDASINKEWLAYCKEQLQASLF